MTPVVLDQVTVHELICDLPATAIKVYLALVANPAGLNKTTLSEYADLSPKTVDTALDTLVEQGYVDRRNRMYHALPRA